MSLVRLIYASRFSARLSADQLRSILRQSRENNPKNCITGVLCYGPGLFLQCLEGPRLAVNVLYGKIVNDSRNKEVTLLEYAEIDERAFEKWSMAYARADDLTESLILKFSPLRSFDPFAMSSKQALGFVRELLTEREKFLMETATGR